MKRVKGPIGLDSPEWDSAAADVLGPLPRANSAVTRKTTLRTLYDQDNFYLRMESQLPARG